MIAGFGYSLFAIFKFIMNICASLFETEQAESSEIPADVFDEEEKQKIRSKRLEFLAKQRTISDQLNLEAKIAKTLGIEEELNENEQTQDLVTANNSNSDSIDDDVEEED